MCVCVCVCVCVTDTYAVHAGRPLCDRCLQHQPGNRRQGALCAHLEHCRPCAAPDLLVAAVCLSSLPAPGSLHTWPRQVCTHLQSSGAAEHFQCRLYAGCLPVHLWAHVHSILLAGVPHTEDGPFMTASPALRQAILLAATCRTWKEAAVQACQALQLSVVARSDVAPQYLSPLLAALLVGCKQLALTEPLHFLELAQPIELGVGAPLHCAAKLGLILASCTSVRVLLTGLALPQWPPNMEELYVGGQFSVSAAVFWRLLSSVRQFPRLIRLELILHQDAAAVLTAADCFRCLTALRHLGIEFEDRPLLGSWASLSAATARGVTLQLRLELDWADKDRRQLWSCLAQSRTLLAAPGRHELWHKGWHHASRAAAVGSCPVRRAGHQHSVRAVSGTACHRQRALHLCSAYRL